MITTSYVPLAAISSGASPTFVVALKYSVFVAAVLTGSIVHFTAKSLSFAIVNVMLTVSPLPERPVTVKLPLSLFVVRISVS